MHLIRVLVLVLLCLWLTSSTSARSGRDEDGIRGYDQWQFGDAPSSIQGTKAMNWQRRDERGGGIAVDQAGIAMTATYEADVWYEMPSSRYQAVLWAGYLDDRLVAVLLRFDETGDEVYRLLCKTLKEKYGNSQSVKDRSDSEYEQLRLVDTYSGAEIIAAPMDGAAGPMLVLQFLSPEVAEGLR